MRKIICLFLFIATAILPFSAFAILSMELTRGVAGAIPIAIVPFKTAGNPSQNISGIIENDLQNSGQFKVYGQRTLTVSPSDVSAIPTDYFRKLGTNNVVIGQVQSIGNDRYEVNVQLVDLLQGERAHVIFAKKYTVTNKELRSLAHHISDTIYQRITGVRGIFSTKLAYVIVSPSNNGQMYTLEVSDQDGYNPRPLLQSNEPIMSPAWSPNGKELAYVSFENKRASIYLQDLATGNRRLLSSFPGINGAPAFSKDGSQLALVLSKSGSPNIYLMDIANGHLKQLTRDFYINTEPAFSPNGKSILFTSNRSGGPQIYQVNLNSGSISRVSYDGDYNARASFTSDGNHIAMLHRVNGAYKIAVLDLDSGMMRVLTPNTLDSASPSLAPNGSMVLYDTVLNGRNVLGMVSSDGRVRLVLPARSGDAQDPAWSPYLS
ncbi:MAG: Tol-Pal system beta propeller repeat protein TolB [Gammaproteobacteria bacterium RIFCSPHIGHO2_12_FULL_38_14]|nr:MAG: Tol-Pal system beta propeller repeat protein TolB [Gammaproteobacteria bacterium RIFCSPHIGHO2_12_FULL_38_14]